MTPTPKAAALLMARRSRTLCAAALLILSAWAAHSVAGPRPNVILVLADDQGYGDMSCYGNEYLHTPNMDRLYAESTRLTNFYVSPVCSPSRASLLTGRYNQRTGVWDTYRGRCSLHGDEYTLAEALSDAGYSTGLFGKWHLGRNSPSLPEDQGFGTVVRDIYDPARGRMNPVISIKGREELRSGFLTDILFDEATDWIEGRARSREPFFAFISPRLIHTSAPPQVPESYARRFHQINDLEKHTAEVYGMTELLDECLGRLLDRIELLGIEEDTILIYTSDNGPQMHGGTWSNSRQHRFNRGLRGEKGSIYEGGILVPFFIRWKGALAEGRDLTGVTAHLDLMPTILDLCRVDAHYPNPIDGISLADFLYGNAPLPDRGLFSQFQRAEAPRLWKNTMFRDARYKLVNGRELYDLSVDPEESTDLAPHKQEVFKDLRAQTETVFESVRDTRRFSPTPTSLDQLKDRDIVLSPIGDMTEDGFCIEANEVSEFSVRVVGMQPALFSEGSQMKLVIGDTVFECPIDTDNRSSFFERVLLEPGIYFMRIETDGHKQAKQWVFGLDDPGFREVVILRK